MQFSTKNPTKDVVKKDEIICFKLEVIILNWDQFLIPVIGFVISVLLASLTYFFSKRQQLITDERRLKEKYYLAYIEALSNNVLEKDIDRARSKLSDAKNQLMLIGSAKVVANLQIFTKYIAIDNEEATTSEGHDLLLTKLIKSMRRDLYKNPIINIGYPVISLTGKSRMLNNDTVKR